MWFHFGEFELDGDGRELRRRAGGVTNTASRVEAPPKVLGVLRTLLGAAPRVVTRSELLEIVWEGHVVSPSALNTVMKSLRQILDDSDQRFVRTVHGIGYAFVMPVERRSASISSSLCDARQRLFVGREAEVSTLASWFIESGQSNPVRLYWLHGVGGIGKTMLVQQVESLALERDIPVITISCAHIRPYPEALMSAIAASCGASTVDDIASTLAASAAGLLVLDGYEAIRGIDDWVRERFVQRLPAGWRLLISGRTPPSVRWRADPSWTCAVEVPLGDLSPEEAEALLARRGVEPSERAPIVRFAGGHPLALVLATGSPRERWSGVSTADAGGVAAALLDCFVRDAPSKLHREALECLAVVDALDEPLLAAMLREETSTTECFDWLSTLGMVERHPAGLVLHDLAKTALVTNLAWRNAERLARLVERVYTKIFTDLESPISQTRRRRLVTLLWRMFELHPELAALMSGPELSGAPSVAELDAIAEHVERFEGRRSAAALKLWLERDPTCARVIRDKDGAMLGYSVLVDVEPDDDEARAADPVLVRLDTTLELTEKYSVARWFADCHAYHDVTSVSFGCHILNAERGLCASEGDSSWHVVLVSNPEAWERFAHFTDFRDREASFDLGDRRFTAFAHDLRTRPLLEWFRTYTRRLSDTLATGAMLDLGLRRPARVP